MKDKNIHTGYFLAGILFLTITIFCFITGKALFLADNDIKFISFVTKDISPLGFYMFIIIYTLVGIGLIYRSLLFVPSNRKYFIKKEGFDRRIVGLEKRIENADLSRILIVTAMVILIISIVFYVFNFL